jgi:hypothetical protein
VVPLLTSVLINLSHPPTPFLFLIVFLQPDVKITNYSQGRSEVRAGRGSCPPLEERSDNAHELLCETRWSQKYKSIAIFNKHFEEIINGLGIISTEGNAAARKTAYQLHCAATKSVFIICVTLIAKYSGILEPVANALQSKAVEICTRA